jgi:RNA polymerase sigma-70 factor (ECF subfamily)
MLDAETRIDQERLRVQIDRALASLEQTSRDALLLFVYAGLSYDEIASALCLPVGTIKSRISRAKAKLRELLSGLKETTE